MKAWIDLEPKIERCQHSLFGLSALAIEGTEQHGLTLSQTIMFGHRQEEQGQRCEASREKSGLYLSNSVHEDRRTLGRSRSNVLVPDQGNPGPLFILPDSVPFIFALHRQEEL